jgi:hypothetical protein
MMTMIEDLRRSAAYREPERSRYAILPSNDLAAKAARVVVRKMCARWGLLKLTETACACVSELAANARQHVPWDQMPTGRQVARLVMRVCGPLLVIEIRDPDPRLPIVGPGIDWAAIETDCWALDALPTRGLGLFTVVERLRAAGGEFGSVPLEDGGKSVFFSLPLPGAHV